MKDGGAGDTVDLVLTNSGKHPRKVSISNAYDQDKARKVTVPPMKTITREIELEDSHGWYDVSVADDDAPAYLRRFAGHHENGKPSYSDPAGGGAPKHP
jgi:phospholipase C